MDINAKGVFFGMQAAARKMVAKGSGCIVNMSSMAGFAGNGPTAVYCTSKGAIKLMTYSAAHALAAQGVRVNAVHPGVIVTDMITGDFGLPEEAMAQVFPMPIGRPAQPEEVGDAVVLLCSEYSRYVTGASLSVDGGIINTFG
jgi:NAD(P)-dependent dehydrogenase (short-subunit alcohol dehydrogenase family)